MAESNKKSYTVVIVIIIVIIVGVGIAYYLNRRGLPHKISNGIESLQKNITKKENFTDRYGDNTNSSNSDDDSNMITYGKRKYKKGNPRDIEDIFDIDAMMPQESRPDWFEIDHIQKPEKIKGNMIIPKHHIGYNTVGTYRKNPNLDIRGDIPIPKTMKPDGFLYSTIDENPYSRGIDLGTHY